MCFPRFERASLVGAIALFLVHSIGALHAQTSFPGCTDPDACNYNVAATVDDGTCIYAIVDDDCEAGGIACSEGMYWNPVLQKCLLIACENCVGDLTGDGFINTADLLDFLAVFGNDCPMGGCTDVYALNYNPDAGYNDGSCVFSPCDLVQLGDPCDDEDANTYNDVIQGEECGCLGTPYVDPTGNGACAGQTFASYQGYDYRLVEIGDQCWFQENCRFLPDVVPSTTCSDSVAYSYVYGYNGTDVTAAMNVVNYEVYGALYNQPAVQEWQLCPSGFHIASDDDWRVLEMTFGLTLEETFEEGWRGTNQGQNIKDAILFDGADSLGMSMLPGGYRDDNGFGFFKLGESGYLWTSTSTDAENGYYRGASLGDETFYRRNFLRSFGFSTRCVADAALGCTEPGACNFDPVAQINDGSCIALQGEGTWCDDLDTTTFNDVILADGCTCEGTPYVALDGSGPCEATNVVTYQGYDYRLVEIGDQCWFADNLRSQHYLNGDSILHASDAATWAEYADLDTGGICASDYDESLAEVYGYQYNFYAVEDERGLCPSGYHVPSDQEWKDLESFMGMPATLLIDWGVRGYEERYGEELRARNTDFWPYSWLDSMNIRGFEALPNGIATASFGQQYEVNEVAHFWSSTRYITSIVSKRDNSISRSIPSGESIYGNGINRYYNLWQTSGGRGHGMAVRCLKDEGCVSEGPVFDNPYFTDGEVQQISLSCEDGLQLNIEPYELTATDECDGEVLVTMSIDSYPLEVCGTGNLVTYTATNSQGQTATTSYTFEVVDVTGPVINAFAESINISEIGIEWCEASEDLPPVDNQGLFIDVFDACGIVATVEQSYVDGPVDLYLCPGGYGFTRVHTIWAMDNCGNWSTATVEQQVYVSDITPPAIADVTLTVDCAAYDPSSLTALVANELNLSACESVYLTSNGSSTICGFAGVNRFFTAVATDACGNTSTAEVVVQVQDTTAPYLYVYNQDIVVDCSASDSDIFNSVYFETADNCSDVTVSMEVVPVYDECGLLSGGSYVLVTATDACGNQSFGQVNVQQIDTNPPTIAIPDVTMECDGAGNVDEINAWIASHGGAFVDDCCDVVWSHSVLSNTANAGCGGNVVVNFTATDVFGNSSTSTAVAFIVDNTPPTLTLSQEPEMYVFSDPDPFGWCGTPNVDFVFPVGEPLAGVFVYASDNCSDVTYSHSYVDSNPQSTGCGADYTFIRTHILVAEDACGNLTTESIDQVVQVDYEVPDFSGWDVTLSCSDSPDYSVFVNEIQNALPSCSNYTVSSELLNTSYPGCYEAQYDFQVTIADGCGGTTSIAGVIHSIDNLPPAITSTDGLANGDTLVTCEGTLPPIAQVYGTDNCSDVTIVYSEESEIYSDNGQGESGVLHTRMYTLFDCVGNETHFTYYVEEVDECFCPFNSSPDYHFTVETVMNHTEGELAGQTTYRVYLNGVSPLDYLSACGGDGLDPLILQSTSGSWYNSPYNGSWNASGVNPLFFSFIPELAFDSYVTIGAGDNLQEPQIHPSLLDYNGELANEFDEDGPGQNLTHDGVGITWFSIFPGIENSSYSAFFGEDLRVLVAQFTTAGELYGQVNVQVFQNGDQGQEFRGVLLFPNCGSPLNP